MIVTGKRRWVHRWLTPALFLAPALILFVTLFAWPAVQAMHVSLCQWSGFTPRMNYTGWTNFVKLWEDKRFEHALINNFWIMIVGGVVFFVFATLFALALNHPRLRGRKFFQTMIFFPAFISVVGVATFWKLLYAPTSGLLNLGARSAGLEGVPWLSAESSFHSLGGLQIPVAMNSIIAMIVWSGVGGTMILLLAGMRRIPQDYIDAARIDGAYTRQQFFHITVPMMREVILIALSLWLIGSMGFFGHVQALLAPEINEKCQVVSTLQYEYAFNNRTCIFLMGRATAMAVVQVVIVLALVGLVRLLREKESVEY
ncbi:MAG: sugar ABC transporter permease [Planctomycetota bacterium]|nr:sugar ABC transporter permease [Planctomycetota bacterium]